jgi:preprotein translocase subunit SecY|uniref:Protein translocase subunit SecY n=1 Tax=Cyanidiaceae sp. MX-AZ01 TaxID=1503164 RepID=A0A060A8W4_9RHOD|nr:preprotein translocase subunit SecY [Cyanidiaceae sp. MX-AZ01]
MRDNWRNRLGITCLLVAIERFGMFVPVETSSQITSFWFNGGGWFVLGIIPFINASIVMQILISIIPALTRLQKEEGELGQKQIQTYTRYLTLLLAAIQALTICQKWSSWFVVVSGAMLVMWLAEQISHKGIGNGTSILVCSNIAANLLHHPIEAPWAIAVTIIMLTMLGMIALQEAVRALPILSAKQLIQSVGQVYLLPMRLNQGGVMPIIFASSTLALLHGWYVWWLYVACIIFFSHFYNLVIANPKELSENLNKMAVVIPSIRPGSETQQYLNRTLNHITWIGGLGLSVIALLPWLFSSLKIFSGFGATSLLIVIGVSIDTMRQIRTYLIANAYEQMIDYES